MRKAQCQLLTGFPPAHVALHIYSLQGTFLSTVKYIGTTVFLSRQERSSWPTYIFMLLVCWHLRRVLKGLMGELATYRK